MKKLSNLSFVLILLSSLMMIISLARLLGIKDIEPGNTITFIIWLILTTSWLVVFIFWLVIFIKEGKKFKRMQRGGF